MKKLFSAAVAVGLLAVFASSASAQDTTKMVIWYDADGSAYIQNNSKTDTFKLDGYTIASELNDLIPGDYVAEKGWKAFEDIPTQFPAELGTVIAQLGSAALQMGSANPNSGNLTEVTLNPAGLEFSPGEKWFLGKPFTTKPTDASGAPLPGYSFLFKTVDSTQQATGAIVSVPEPSTLVLAGFGLLGLVGLARRRRA